MNLFTWALVGLALVATGVAVQAGNNLSVAVPAASGAVFLISVVGVLEVGERSRDLVAVVAGVGRPAMLHRVESDSLLRLRRAFASGSIGRTSILATIRALERDLSPAGRTLLSLEAERSVLHLPPEEFRAWIDERLRRIEAMS